MRARTYTVPMFTLLALAGASAAWPVPSARADEAADPHKGQFTLAEAMKGIPGPATGALTATIDTSKGKLTCELFDKQTPVTVANFVGLATGKRAWLDTKTNKWVKKPFYNGLTFHRVIPKFMIQGGDPLGTGIGNPGYQFNDEIVEGVQFDKPGLLAMANAGKRPDGSGTNGSQFFITEETPVYLNGRHTIFGKCDPLQVVMDIARVPVGANDKPNEPMTMRKVTIARVRAKPAAAAAAAGGAKVAGGAKAAAEAPAAAKPPAEKSAP